MWGVPWRYSAPYNPQANGQAEAGVKIISNKLRALVNEFVGGQQTEGAKKWWPDVLPYAAMAYNYTPNAITGFAPYELVFGKVPPLPIQVPQVEAEDLRQVAKDHFLTTRLALEEAHRIAESVECSGRRLGVYHAPL